ncbi:MAG: hypothetical protein HWD59_13920 [Coxiellaceae bacterium]|nr:MAG: hypothetical protein HWD59_13920 [Coxiellaceae bacterium]
MGGSRLSVSPANAEGLEEIPVVRYKAIFDAKYRSLSGLLNQFSNVQNKLELLQQLKQELVQELDKFCRQYQDNQSLKALAPTYPHPLNSSQQISLADLIEFYIKETEATLENHADNDNNAGSSRSLGQRSDVEEEDPDVYSPKGTFD